MKKYLKYLKYLELGDASWKLEHPASSIQDLVSSIQYPKKKVLDVFRVIRVFKIGSWKMQVEVFIVLWCL